MNKLALSLSVVALLATDCSRISQAAFDAFRAELYATKEASSKAYPASQHTKLHSHEA